MARRGAPGTRSPVCPPALFQDTPQGPGPFSGCPLLTSRSASANPWLSALPGCPLLGQSSHYRASLPRPPLISARGSDRPRVYSWHPGHKVGPLF